MTALLRYDIARQAIAEAVSFDEVRDWEDKAAAVKEYGRRINDRSMIINALEIQARARRRRGELLIQLKELGQLAEGRKKTLGAGDIPRTTLKELDITKDESSRDQKIAAIDGNSYERLLTRCRKHLESHPEKSSIDVLRPGPINGARAIMGDRQEPDDSLDFFPTPPWATRALMEHAFPQLGYFGGGGTWSAWEPACGEGHMAEVLTEYFDYVYAADIFDYGYSERACDDFMKVNNDTFDWIITNPPFGDNAIKFVAHALDLAQIGVAMFFRSQWAVEGIERYEQIFRDRPPTLCAFFVERVNLCKGEWNPYGTTATAYCWLVWVKGQQPKPPFWIPPGCRESLTRPDDIARFAPQYLNAKPDAQPHVILRGSRRSI
jgi:hypothetical protein